jgi:WD40 repeat protein
VASAPQVRAGQRSAAAKRAQVTIWDARNATEVAGYTLPGNLKSITFSGDGKLLLNVSNEGTVLITDMISLKERARDIIADTFISAGAITIDGKKMILVSRNGVINIWDLPVEQSGGGQIFNRYVKMFEIQDEDDEGRPSPMTCVAISPNVKRVFVGMSGGLCKVFELSMTEGLSVIHILSGHTSVVCSCSFSSDGQRVATAALDHTLKVWDVKRGGKPLNSFEDPTEVRAPPPFPLPPVRTGHVSSLLPY